MAPPKHKQSLSKFEMPYQTFLLRGRHLSFFVLTSPKKLFAIRSLFLANFEGNYFLFAASLPWQHGKQWVRFSW